MNLIQILALVQGAYFAITGIWPLLHMRSFLAVTGPKTDLWLVRTVGLLVLAIGVTLLLAVPDNRVSPELQTLALLSAAALTAIDVTYVYRRVIAPIYLLDAVAEIVLILGWLVAMLRATSPQ